MVLKKSNSFLNTGATQILSNRGAIFNDEGPSTNRVRPGTITVDIERHEGLSSKEKDDVQESLEKIYQIMEWDGPDISSFYDKNGLPHYNDFLTTFSYVKDEDTECVPLPERAKRLMDANFEGDSVEVVLKIGQCCGVNLYNDKLIVNWVSTNFKEKRSKSNTKEDRKMRRIENKLNQHKRGVQRLGKISYDAKSNEEKDNDHASLPLKVIITIQKPHAVDARLLQKRHLARRYRRMKKKSQFKRKGYINGLKSDFKGYDIHSLRVDEMEAALDATEEEDFHAEFENYQSSGELFSGEESMSLQTYDFKLNQNCLSEYIVPIPPKSKAVKPFTLKNKESEMTVINSASSQKTVKYLKGSYEFITTANKISHNDLEGDSGFESNLSETSELNESLNMSESDNEDLHEFDIDKKKGVMFQFDLETNISDFISKFVNIDLIFPTDILDDVLNTPYDSCNTQTYSFGHCLLQLGNCYPPTFVVKANSEICDYDNNWYLSGKAVQLNLGTSFAWKVQIGGINSCSLEDDDRVMNMFYDTLQGKGISEITLQELVKIFQESIRFCSSKENDIDPMYHQNHSLLSQPSQSPWNTLKHYVNETADTKTVKEALRTLKDSSDHVSFISNATDVEESIDHSLSSQDSEKKSAFHLQQDSSTIFCDICFLPCDFSQCGDSQALALIPCGHIFCLNCWSAHAYISLHGADPIRCMESDCKQEIDQAVLRSLAPGHMVNKWSQRLHDKKIERDPMCKWCPNTQCNKVATVKQLSTKLVQFGSLVSCDCNVAWCFSCQKEPHWPASCEQMTEFRKLLNKTGNDLEIPVERVDFAVQLKPCPKCKYPIEKNEGCPSMMCRMCWFNFCWNCLRPVDHNVYSCKARADNFVTFNLRNDLVHNLPLKFFPDYLKMNKNKLKIQSTQIFLWLQEIKFSVNMPRFRIPAILSLRLKLRNDDEAKEKAESIALSSVQFLSSVYTFLESFYVLLCFVNMNKERPQYALNECRSVANCLLFIAWRLEEKVIFKNLLTVVKYSDTATFLLECGRKHMLSLKKNIPALQGLTKNIDTSGISDLDLEKYMRYK